MALAEIFAGWEEIAVLGFGAFSGMGMLTFRKAKSTNLKYWRWIIPSIVFGAMTAFVAATFWFREDPWEIKQALSIAFGFGSFGSLSPEIMFKTLNIRGSDQ